jgi:RES domain-containing protein
MDVFRITHLKWSNRLVASGYAARWNSNGTFVIYSAESASLACLENLVHRNGFGLDTNYSLITISIPNAITKIEIKSSDLPSNWNLNDEKAHLICRKYGDDWIRNQKSAILIVPSAIITNEKNIIINPNHKDFSKIEIKEIQTFSFDKRLLH